jgi:hypothetical protein
VGLVVAGAQLLGDRALDAPAHRGTRTVTVPNIVRSAPLPSLSLPMKTRVAL